MIKLLQKNKGEFTWSSTDISGLDPSMVVYSLNLDPNAKKVVQKKRMFTPER